MDLEIYSVKSVKLYIFCIKQKNLMKKYMTILSRIQYRYDTKMDAIFTNLKNNKTSDPCRLILNLSDKINLKRSHKYFALSNLDIYY